MGFEAIEHVCDLLVLDGSKSGYVDQRLHSLGACESYDRAGVGVSGQYDRPFRPVQTAVKGGYVVSKRGQRKRRRQHLNGLTLECRYDPSPTRSIRPCSMGEHYAHILHRHPVAPDIAGRQSITCSMALDRLWKPRITCQETFDRLCNWNFFAWLGGQSCNVDRLQFLLPTRSASIS